MVRVHQGALGKPCVTLSYARLFFGRAEETLGATPVLPAASTKKLADQFLSRLRQRWIEPEQPSAGADIDCSGICRKSPSQPTALTVRRKRGAIPEPNGKAGVPLVQPDGLLVVLGKVAPGGHGCALVAEPADKESEVVLALDRRPATSVGARNGKARCRYPSSPLPTEVESAPLRHTTANACMPQVCATFSSCLNAESGQEKWRVDFVSRFDTPLPAFGFVCSPLVDGNAVYVQAGASVRETRQTDRRDDWRTLDDGGGMFGSPFSLPTD